MIRSPRKSRLSAEKITRDKAFWADLLALRAEADILPPHCGAGYGHRRFCIVRDAAWVTLYRAVTPYPQVGVFLRCRGLAGEALFTLADGRRNELEPRLRQGLGADAVLGWGTSFHPGMTDVIASIAAPLPWDDAACGLHAAWLLRTGALWWTCFVALTQS
jgi:hypothetical protein